MDRRIILKGLIAASTATLVAPASATTENPKLIELGGKLDAVEARHAATMQARKATIKAAMAEWPRAPKEIYSFGARHEYERDVTGVGFQEPDPFRKGQTRAISIGTVETFSENIKYGRHEIARIEKTKTKRGLNRTKADLEAKEAALLLAQTYWAEVERITVESGYTEANDKHKNATKALIELVQATMDEPETSMAGVVIKAQALSAWGKVSLLDQMVNFEGHKWSASLAQSLLRQAQA